MSTRYELLYIIPTTFTDEEVGTIETKVSGILTRQNAVIESTRRLGKFKLAYPIKKQRHGHYVMVLFTAETPVIAKIEEMLRITPEVLRHLTLKADEAGEDQKFELVQFAEVIVESTRDDRNRRREKPEREDKAVTAKVEEKAVATDVTEVASVSDVLETEEEKIIEAPVITIKNELSSEELDKKIETALNEDVKVV